ncbi:MAG: hypothetical protein MK212_01635 [Saprospiraceae bacterium]|nr:hypothetical protein [Saprospiraceae bacterium]
MKTLFYCAISFFMLLIAEAAYSQEPKTVEQSFPFDATLTQLEIYYPKNQYQLIKTEEAFITVKASVEFPNIRPILGEYLMDQGSYTSMLKIKKTKDKKSILILRPRHDIIMVKGERYKAKVKYEIHIPKTLSIKNP